MVHRLRSLCENVLQEPTCRDEHVMLVAEIHQFDQRRPRHERERASRELEGIDILTHGFEDVLQVALAHWGVIGATDLGKAAGPWLRLALVGA